MPPSVRIWMMTGALFLALLPSLPLGITQLQVETCGCDKQSDSACRRLCARQGRAAESARPSQVEGDCSINGCSMRSRPHPDGTPAEGPTVRQAVTPKAAPGDGNFVVPTHAASGRLQATASALPPTPWLEIQVPPPRPLQLV